jgi:Ca2+-binding RTX toxin-like protein
MREGGARSKITLRGGIPHLRRTTVVKLVAEKKVDTHLLPELDPITGDFYDPITMQGAYVHGTSQMRYRFGNTLIDLTNNDDSFAFAAGYVYQGNVNTVEVSKGGNPAWKITNALFRIEDLYDDAQDGKLDTLPAQIFSGKDKIFGSPADDTLFGFKGADLIKGKAGDDHIKGGRGSDQLHGGTGDNVLYGNKGNDTFFFDEKVGTFVDRIKDFDRGHDLIALDNEHVFKQLDALGATLKAKNFHVGAHAQDGNDFLIYHQNTGALFYDKDGNGPHSQVKIAVFDNAPHLSTDDFFLLLGAL